MQELAAAIASEAALRSRLAEATAQLERERYQSRAWKAEHDRVEAAHRKTLRSRLRRAVKALGKGPYRSLETYRRDVLAGVEPSVVLDDWAARTAGRKSFVMLCHDQMIDRRIIHQARSLTAAGWAGIIVAVSSDADDHIETAEGVPVHRIGLARIIPDCPVYWRQQNRQRLIQWWGRWQGLLHKLDQWWYAAELRTVYHCRSVTYPLPFDRCYYAAAKHYRAGVIVAHDLPALGGGTSWPGSGRRRWCTIRTSCIQSSTCFPARSGRSSTGTSGKSRPRATRSSRSGRRSRGIFRGSAACRCPR